MLASSIQDPASEIVIFTQMALNLELLQSLTNKAFARNVTHYCKIHCLWGWWNLPVSNVLVKILQSSLKCSLTEDIFEYFVNKF